MTSALQLFSRHGKSIAVSTFLVLGTTQCAETSDGRLAQGQGAGIGALGGALLGGAIGGRDGALLGAGIGALGGYAYGSHIANKKAQYKSTEEWLDACISQAESKRRAAVAYNRKLNNRLASLEREVRVAKAAGNKSQLSSLKREISSERTAAQKESAGFTKEAELQRSAIKQAGPGNSSRLSSLRSSTSGIETQVSGINRNVERYAALESQIDV